MARDIRWILRSKTFKYEVVKFVVLAVALGVSSLHLSEVVFPGLWRGANRGLTYHLTFGVISTFGWNADGVFILLFGIYLGLVGLVIKDNFKQFVGLLLAAATMLAVAVMWANGTFFPTLNWAGNIPSLLAGIAVGAGGGGLVWRGYLPTPGSVSHRYFLADRGDPEEYPEAIPRMLALVGVVFLLAYLESIAVYRSPIVTRGGGGIAVQTFEFIRWEPYGAFTDLLMVGAFLGALYAFRQYTKDQTAVIIGPSGSGKTTMMAGLGYTLGKRGWYHEMNQPLRELVSALRDGGFAEFPGTPPDRVVPLSVAFRHGWLFPTKVEVRVIDYAGEHLHKLKARTSRSDVHADSADEIFEIAKYVCSTTDVAEESSTEMQFYDQVRGMDITEHGGYDEYADRPADLAVEMVSDLLYYADAVGMVLPLDFEEYLKQVDVTTDLPEYVGFDDEGNPEPMTDRAAKAGGSGAISSKEVAKKYGALTEEVSGDSFYVLTMSDLAVPSYPGVNGAGEPDDWEAFTDHVVRTFIPPADATHLTEMFLDTETTEYDRDSTKAVYFSVREDDGEPELVNMADPELHGSVELGERIGRTGWFEG